MAVYVRRKPLFSTLPFFTMDHTAFVSIIIPNLNGRDMLEACISSVEKLDYPKDLIECIVVDNGSVDGSQYFLTRHYQNVRIVSLSKNLGFASAINKGAEVATGEILFLLNNDALPDVDCLSLLVKPILAGQTVCTTAQIINQERTDIHFAGGGMNFHGIAYQAEQGKPYQPEADAEQYCLFPCGAAMAIKRDIFLEVGGMDDDFFAYFEDVDLGWRLWLMGYDVLYVPKAITSHSESQTSRFISLNKIRVLHIRNPLMMIYKNYEEVNLTAILPVAWMLTSRRTLHLSGIDRAPFRIGNEKQLADTVLKTNRPVNLHDHETDFPMLAISDFVALNDWLDNFDNLEQKRSHIQEHRVRPDEQIIPMFRDPFRYCEQDDEYRQLQDKLCERFGINKLFDNLCPDVNVP